MPWLRQPILPDKEKPQGLRDKNKGKPRGTRLRGSMGAEPPGLAERKKLKEDSWCQGLYVRTKLFMLATRSRQVDQKGETWDDLPPRPKML